MPPNPAQPHGYRPCLAPWGEVAREARRRGVLKFIAFGDERYTACRRCDILLPQCEIFACGKCDIPLRGMKPHGRTQFAPTALPKSANSAQNPCLPREGGVGVADGGSVKGQTPPVSHPLDSPLGEGAKKDCAYARKICTNPTSRRQISPENRKKPKKGLHSPINIV